MDHVTCNKAAIWQDNFILGLSNACFENMCLQKSGQEIEIVVEGTIKDQYMNALLRQENKPFEITCTLTSICYVGG